LLPLVLLPAAVALTRTVREHSDGPTLNLALARTGMLQLGFCVLLSAGLLLS
jgi:1,4-dihydroxy-2-naphthoate octaprenyltransferase